jgi:hypothetical protein
MAGAYAMFDGVSSPLTQTFGLGIRVSVIWNPSGSVTLSIRPPQEALCGQMGHDLTVSMLLFRSYSPGGRPAELAPHPLLASTPRFLD